MRIGKKRLFPRITRRVLMTGSAGLLMLSYLSTVIDPAKVWFMTIFGLLFLPLLILNLVLLIWAVLRRSGFFLIPFLALLPAVFFIKWYFRFPCVERQDTEGISIMSYNVGRFSLYKKGCGISGQDDCADSVFSFIRKSDADIISLQEFYISDDSGIRSFLKKKFPEYNAEYFMYVNKNGCYGNVTLSRFPVAGKGKFVFDKSSNLAIYTDYDIKGTRIRVYDCHFESYNISLSRLAKAFGKDDQFMKETETKMHNSITRRPKQVDEVLSDIRDCPIGAIVTGDFNDNPLSYTYNRLSRGRKDSFVEAGSGMGATYSVLRPFLRIDYILFPVNYSAVNHHVIYKPYSDHYPIIAKIGIK
ncbi:MAG: endonuclease/exonuclease/phosphatase family protein [Bacteroidales bacterium]|nr:endonuclease/exonuclease/phosphatase family protein [Bacteroidales bacterium]MCI1786399.1 endonuclease/exonuclease/phosphatase family protein [Bacteroidales bacterium]